MNSPSLTIARFGFRQTIKGALWFAFFIGIMAGVQGPAYVGSYPTQESREQFAKTLESAPALGILYGEPKNIDTPAGYIAYRVLPFTGFVAAVWALMTTTKLLRGQEEDGRGELILSGKTSLGNTSTLLLIGFLASLITSAIISSLLLGGIGTLPEIHLPLGQSFIYTLAIFGPAIAFAGVGTFVSQLSVTRRRAATYGITLLIVFFALRAIGNTVPDFSWLKQMTPFGWAELISPVIDTQMLWLLAPIMTLLVLASIAIYIASKRDFGTGALPESDTATSRYFLLGNPASFSLRQALPSLFGWTIIALFVSGLITALSDLATRALQDSPLKGAIDQLSGTHGDPKIAFIGSGLVFTVFILLLMTTTSIGGIRATEAKNYLDTLLTQPLHRSSWLSSRLMIIALGTFILSLLSGLLVWAIAASQHTQFELLNFLFICITLVGTAVFTLGVGTLLYGFFPRIAVIGMYLIITWSFIIDLIGSVVKLDDFVVKSSLFHYTTLSPTAEPDWKTFAWLLSLGMGMAIIGIIAFNKRDIISE